MRLGLCLLMFAASAFCNLALAEETNQRDWQRVDGFDEFAFTAAAEPDVRFHVNAPLDDNGQPARATRLVIFALPNGNTIEQTLGCKLTDSLDWHYDIQHVAAQIRLLRKLFPDEQIVLICAEAKGLSWPAWRRSHEDANERIAKLVDQWRAEFGTPDAKIFLTGHSGGGAFKYGVVEGQDDIPDTIDRIAFLDSDYWFEGEQHAQKFDRWLKREPSHRLIVICYDDRNIMLNGKKVVSDTGGTFRGAGRMRDALGKLFPITESQRPPFAEFSGVDGRFRNYVHPNPENKILHTALVGDMNGLVHAATLGTPQEEKWGTFGGPRAYTEFIQPEPTPGATLPKGPAKTSAGVPQSQVPPRPAGAIGGKAFVESIAKLPLAEREAAIEREILAGNFPDFLRTFQPVPVQGSTADGKEIVASLLVMPDYLAVGSNDDFVRLPMTPQTAQRIADRFGCTLPTRKMVDAIDSQAELHVEPRPLTVDRESVKTFEQHHEIIESQRAGQPLGQLITGIKKDIVLTPRIFERPERLAIYGWRQLDGQPIQPLTIVHWDQYVDYSHGARLVLNEVTIDGKKVTISDLLADPKRCGLVSDEGPMTPPRYSL